MSDIRWDLLGGPVDVGSQVQQGFATGMALTKRFQTQHALSAYMQNPDDPQAFTALASLDPQAAATLQEARRGQRKEAEARADQQRRTALGQLYTQDPAGARQEAIASGDFDLAKAFEELGEPERKRTAEFWGQAGSVAMRLKQEPDPARRSAIWAEARPILAAQGAPAHLLDSFNPANDAQLDAAIATAQKVGEVAKQYEIKEFNVGPGEGRYGRDANGNIVTIIAPNAGDQPFGAPAGGGGAIPPPPPGAHIVDDGGPTPSASGTFPR